MQKHLKYEGPSDKEARSSYHTACLTEEDIITYLFGRISEEERFRIEEHFTECDLCYDAVKGARKFSSEKELREHLLRIKLDVSRQYLRSAPLRRGYKILYYSAAALVLIAFSGFTYWLTRNPGRHLADSYIRPFSNTVPLSRSQTKLTLLEEAMFNYESQNYEQSRDLLIRLLQDEPDNYVAHLYCGISALLLDEVTEAVPHLVKASDSPDPRIAEAARWYGALADLKQENRSAARDMLTRIAGQNGYFSDAARTLLEEIDKR